MKRATQYNSDHKEQHMQYLEFIQNIINRHNANSFQIKTFAITIFSAITALYISNQVTCIYLISIIVIVILWFLDATYLSQEWQFRELYDEAINNKIKVYTMSINKYKITICDFFVIMFSKTIAPLYISLLIMQILVIIYMRCNVFR